MGDVPGRALGGSGRRISKRTFGPTSTSNSTPQRSGRFNLSSVGVLERDPDGVGQRARCVSSVVSGSKKNPSKSGSYRTSGFMRWSTAVLKICHRWVQFESRKWGERGFATHLVAPERIDFAVDHSTPFERT